MICDVTNCMTLQHLRAESLIYHIMKMPSAATEQWIYEQPFITTRRVPVEGKSSVCLNMICMKFRIIILIIISLVQILLLYIANTSPFTHANARAGKHTHTAVAAVQVSTIHWHPTVTASSSRIKNV